MENATKALLISGGILIALLVISIGIYLFMSYRTVGSSYDQSMQISDIRKFNVNFTKFEGRKDITIHEIVSLANFAREYNESNGTSVEVKLGTEDLTEKNHENKYLIDLTEKIKYNDKKKYEASISEPDTDGMIKSIRFL